MASKPKKPVSTREAIIAVLSKADAPMATSDVIEQALKLVTNLSGKSPKQTVYSVLYSEAKKPNGAWKKTGAKGKTRFSLRAPKGA